MCCFRSHRIVDVELIHRHYSFNQGLLPRLSGERGFLPCWTPEGWLYLAVMLDLFARRVVGWSVNERLERGWRWTLSGWRSRTGVDIPLKN
jgi:transposase InsO family protein